MKLNSINMSPKQIKFLATNCSVLLIMLILLFRHFSIIGLISFIIGGLLLFLGTYLDYQKAEIGVACKLSYILFISSLILLGLWLPSILKNNQKVTPPTFTVPALIVSLSFFALGLIASNQKNFISRRIFKYMGQIALMIGVSLFLNFPLPFIFSFVIVIIVFCICDIFSCKFKMTRIQDFNHETNPDRSYWMSLCICLVLGFYFLYSGTYVYKYIGTISDILKTLSTLTNGLKIPLFALLMIVLTAVFMMVDRTNEIENYSDSYLSISLFGFSIALWIFSSMPSWYNFAVYSIAIAVSVSFGMSTISNETHRINPEKINLKKMLRYDGISLTISAIAIFGMIFIDSGFLVSFITLAVLVIFVICVHKTIKGLWVADAIRWQSILVAISAFAISMAIVKNNISVSWPYILAAFLTFSLFNWAISIRKGEWDNTGMTASKVSNCLLLAVISIVAAV